MKVFPGSEARATLAMVFMGGAMAVSAVMTPRGGGAWTQNFRAPSAVAVRFQGAFNAWGVGQITLGGQTAAVTNDYDDTCGELWLYTAPTTVYLTPRQTYALTLSGSAIYGLSLTGMEAPDPPTLPSATNGNQTASLHYRPYIWNTNSTLTYYNPTNHTTQTQTAPGWEPLCAENLPAWNTESEGDGSCDTVSLTVLIQIRPDGSARPLAASSAEEEKDESGSRDEAAIDAKTAPGDGARVTMAAGQSADPASTSVSWSVELGRLWNGASAGKILLLAQRLNDGMAYTPGCLSYGARSSDTNEIDVLTASTDSTVIRQIRAPQTFVNVNSSAATASVVVTNHGVLTNVTLMTVGGRYAAAPTVTVHDAHGTGSNAVITAQVSSNGIVTALVLSNPGTNYSSATTVTIAAPSNSFSIDFYAPSAVAGSSGGFFTINSNASPFVSWWIDSPSNSVSVWRVRELRNGGSHDTTLQYDSVGGDVWTLREGSGTEARVETRAVLTGVMGDVTNRQETQQVSSGGGTVSDKTVEMYEEFPGGWQMVAVTNDPGGAKLVTTFSYRTDTNTGDYGQLTFTQYPDGFWEQRVYGDTNIYPYPYEVVQGSLFRVINPWLNGPAGPIDPTSSAIEQCLVTQYGPNQEGVYGDGGYGLVKWHNAAQYGENEWGPQYLIESRAYAEETIFDEEQCLGGGDYVEETHSVGEADGDSRGMPGKTTTRWEGSYGRLAGANYSVADTCVPGGAMDCYDYEFGQWNPGSYTFSTNGPATNDVRKIVYHASATWTIGLSQAFNDTSYGDPLYVGDSGAPMAPRYLSRNQSTKDVTILQNGNVAARERYVYTASGTYALIDRTIYQRDALGHATNVFRVDPLSGVARTLRQADWQGGASWPADTKLSETDETGIEMTYVYDSLKRVKTKTKQGVSIGGYPAQSAVVTTLGYDAAGRVLTNSVSAGGLSQNTISVYDMSGRLTSLTTPDGLTTSYTFSGGGQQTNIMYSSGATMALSDYLDRRIASITGSAVTNQYFTYGQFYTEPPALFQPVDENEDYIPRNFTTNTLGNPNSGRWTVTCTDAAGNECLRQRPAFGSASPHYTYDFRISNPRPYGSFETTDETNSGGGPRFKTTLYCYDFTGNVISELINVCSNYYDDMSAAGWASMDRGFTNDWSYQMDGSGAWFKVTQRAQFLADNQITPTIIQTTKERLTGFGANQKAETIIYDAFGNLTDTNVTINFANRTVTTTVTNPQSILPVAMVTLNGLLQTETTPTVAVPTWHFYDALGRETGQTDPLGSSIARTYDPVTGQITSLSDPAGNATVYYYYPAGGTNAGLLHYEINAAGAKTYYGYDSCGRVIHKWGDVPYPEELAYDADGELSTLRSYRGGSSWNGATWPSSPGSADTTSWLFDSATGFLTNKADASGSLVSYTYCPNGEVATGRLARGLSWTRSYDELGDLLGTTYSDSTPAVVYTNQDRRGLARGIIDATGNSTLGYDVIGRLTNRSWSSGLFSGLSLSNHFNNAHGQDAVAALGLSGKVETDYGYDAYGRINGLVSTSNRMGYNFLPNSDLPETAIYSNASAVVLTTTREWKNGFQLRSIANSVAGAAVTARTYTYDNLNRATQTTLEDGSMWKYGYDNRNELARGARYWSDWTPVSGQQFAYGYDNAGNRGVGQSGSAGIMRSGAYSASGLDEYTNIVTPGYKDVLGAAIASNTVTVNGGTADRKGEYFHRETVVTNAGGPVWHPVSVSAGGSTNGGLVVAGNTQALAYDADGNLTFDGIWIYAWDAENRLIEMTMTNSIANLAATNRWRLDFAYDCENRRISKTVSTNSTGNNFIPQSANYYLYAGGNLLSVFAPGRGVQQAFAWGPDMSGTVTNCGGIEGLAVLYAAGTNHFPGYDGKGNVVMLVSAADKTTTARYEYAPFGEVMRATGPLAKQNCLGFSTKFYDGESGLVYYGGRYYQPTQGRWLGRDTAKRASANPYLFCQNEALNRVDPDGCMDLNADPARAWKQVEAWYEQVEKVKATETDPELIQEAVETYEAMKVYVNETCKAAGERGIYWGGPTAGESGFVTAEMAELGTTVIGGAAIGIGGGMMISYVVDQTSQALGSLMKAEISANNMIIDSWADTDSKFQ